jgi:hypothetical protein
MVAGKSRVGISKTDGKRDREERIKGGRDGAWERTENGVGWKWLLEMAPEILGINRTIKRQSKWT